MGKSGNDVAKMSCMNWKIFDETQGWDCLIEKLTCINGEKAVEWAVASSLIDMRLLCITESN